MAKCLKCNVIIKDNTLICPLCQHILEQDPGETLTNTYPNIEQKRKKTAFALRIYAFAAIVAEALLALINYKLFAGVFWCVISGMALLYAYLTIWFSFQKNADFRIKLLFQALSGILFLVAVDLIYGFKGWSVCIGFPVIILSLDALTFILMLINRSTFHTYLWVMLLLTALSVIPVVLYVLGYNQAVTLAATALGVSIVIVLGMLLIGGQKARTELKRRFHV